MKNQLFFLFIFLQLSVWSQENGPMSQHTAMAAPIYTPVAPEITTKFPQTRDFTLSSSGTEAFFTGQSVLGEVSAIIYMRKEKGQWVKPEVASFSGKYKDLEPFFSPDGLRLYFVSNRPLKAETDSVKDFDIWYVQRANLTGAWSAPVNIGSPVNTSADEFYPSVSAKNNLVFTSDAHGSKGKDDIFYAKWTGSGFADPVSVGDSINTAGYEFNAYLSPDESVIIYTAYNRPGGFGSGDLYISLKKGDGSWDKSINLGGDINSKYMDYCPFVDVKKKVLYFTSKRSTLDNSSLTQRSLPELLKLINQVTNGESRIYEAEFSSYAIYYQK
jgi:Tol biopolymer transport system component